MKALPHSHPHRAGPLDLDGDGHVSKLELALAVLVGTSVLTVGVLLGLALLAACGA